MEHGTTILDHINAALARSSQLLLLIALAVLAISLLGIVVAVESLAPAVEPILTAPIRW